MKQRRILFVLTLLTTFALAGAARADGPAWTYVEAGYNNVDVDDLNDDGDGLFVGGSFAFKSIHVFGRWSDNSTDDFDIDVSKWYAGAGWHGGLGEKADLFGDLAYVDAELGSASESGYFARAGVRWRPIKLFEAGVNGRWEDLGDFDDDFVWEATAMVYVWRLGIGVNWEASDVVDTVNVFARFNFGGR